MPSNRSSSSCSSPLAVASGRSNPNLRNSETNNSIRRSFSGNPFHKPSIIANPRSYTPYTPANSPSEFAPRNSVGGGRENMMGSFSELDDKENGKDHIFKSSKVRSPAGSVKGMKNFMCPTISAAFKVTESPRKKVLTDKNEPARTAISSSLEIKSPHRKVVTFDDSTEEKKLPNNRKVTFADAVEEKLFQPFPDGLWEEESDELADSLVSEDSASLDSIEEKKPQPFTEALKAEGFDSKNETEAECEAVINGPDCVNLDPSFRLSPTPPPFSSTSTIIAPLDADPLIPSFDLKDETLIPPYDPKVNYLSPRPQFLRYKPNPRLQLYKEMTSMKLHDESSDTELTEEEALSGGGSENEADVSSDEIASEVVQNHVSEAIEEAKGVSKQGFSMRSKAIALFLLLSVACFSVSYTKNPQVFDPFLKELATWSHTCDSSEIYQFASANFDRFSELAKANLDGLGRNFHIWFTKLMSSTSKLISSLRGVQDSPVQWHYWNLTSHLDENNEIYQFPTFGQELYLLQVAVPVLKAENTEGFTDTSVVDVNADTVMEDHYYASAYEEQVVQELEPVPPITDHNDIDAVVIAEIESALFGSKIWEASEPKLSGIHDEVESSASISLMQEPVPPITDHNDIDAVVIAEIESALFGSKIWEASEPKLSEIHAEVESSASVSEVGEANTDYSHSVPNEIHTKDFEAELAPEKNSVSDRMGHKVELDLKSEIHTDSKPESDVHTKMPDDVHLKSPEEKSLGPVIVASIILFISIIAGAVFKYLKKKEEGRRTRTTDAVSSMEHKEEAASSLEKPFMRNNPIEMDALGGSSEISSSYERSSPSYYYSQRGLVREQTEAQSMEKRARRSNRRESLASSSDMASGSASYGSFTTYEKRGEGVEAVTPVRRSNRIRNLATSPSTPL